MFFKTGKKRFSECAKMMFGEVANVDLHWRGQSFMQRFNWQFMSDDRFKETIDAAARLRELTGKLVAGLNRGGDVYAKLAEDLKAGDYKSARDALFAPYEAPVGASNGLCAGCTGDETCPCPQAVETEIPTGAGKTGFTAVAEPADGNGILKAYNEKPDREPLNITKIVDADTRQASERNTLAYQILDVILDADRTQFSNRTARRVYLKTSIETILLDYDLFPKKNLQVERQLADIGEDARKRHLQDLAGKAGIIKAGEQ